METKDKKLRILQKAEELFAEHGFSGTSVREIANEAGVNVAMISYYFGSKDQLLIDIFLHRNGYLKTKVDDLLNNSTLSWWNKLDLFIEHYVQKFRMNQCLHQIIMREANLNANDKISGFLMEQKKNHYQMFHHFIQQGQKIGEFNRDVDIIWLYTLFPGIVRQVLLNKDFMKTIIEEETGEEPTSEVLIQLTTNQLKIFFRKILEIK